MSYGVLMLHSWVLYSKSCLGDDRKFLFGFGRPMYGVRMDLGEIG
jgi:hypothetical protein